MWKEAGCKVIPVVASAALARRMGVAVPYAVVAEGCEAGGHIGELTTMALTPAVCDAVSIPLLPQEALQTAVALRLPSPGRRRRSGWHALPYRYGMRYR